MKKLNLNPFLLFIILIAFFFYPVFFKGLMPFSGDLLLAEYQPWRSFSYNGIASGGVTNKGQYFDTLRQLYPWKTFALNSIKKGYFPLWNPHNFSGSPLFANFQSGLLYPLNIFYLFFPQIIAWSVLIMLQPFLCLVFTYFLCRKYKLSKIASIFSAVSFAFCLYQTSFLEYNIMGHFMYLLPMSILGIEYFFSKKILGSILLSTSIVLAGFAGHVQLFAGIVFYILIYAGIRILQTEKENKKRLLASIQILFFILIGIGINAIQLFPGLELINQASRSLHAPDYFYNSLLIRPYQLILYFIPDIFGNPANKNYLVSFSYPSKALYIGLFGIYFSILSFFIKSKNEFWKAILVISLIISSIVFLNPISYFLFSLNIPFLSTSSPSNFIFFVSFGLSIFAGFGLDNFIHLKNKSLVLLILFWIIFGSIFVLMVFNHSVFSKNNIFYSLIILFTITFTIFIANKIKKNTLIGILIITISVFDLFYFFHKFNSFSPISYVYPKTTIGEYLSKNTGINRVWGYGSAGIEANFATQLGIYSTDGYDPLYPKTYGEFIQTSSNGKIPLVFTDQNRSDAVIVGGYGNTDMVDNKFRLKLLSLMGVKYILDKTENGSTDKTFPVDQFKNIATIDDFKVFEYKNVAPRFFLTTSYFLYKSKEEFVKNLFNPSFNTTKSILLNEKVDIDSSVKLKKNETSLILYSPNKVIIKTKTDEKSLLYLSDTYFPGWNAYVDNKLSKIYLANYTFRAVIVPKGDHVIEFNYQPKSVLYGLYVTIISTILLLLSLIYVFYEKNK